MNNAAPMRGPSAPHASPPLPSPGLVVVGSSSKQQWLKYGEKNLSDGHTVRAYYKCSEKAKGGCQAKRMVDFIRHSLDVTHVQFKDPHNHPVSPEMQAAPGILVAPSSRKAPLLAPKAPSVPYPGIVVQQQQLVQPAMQEQHGLACWDGRPYATASLPPNTLQPTFQQSARASLPTPPPLYPSARPVETAQHWKPEEGNISTWLADLVGLSHHSGLCPDAKGEDETESWRPSPADPSVRGQMPPGTPGPTQDLPPLHGGFSPGATGSCTSQRPSSLRQLGAGSLVLRPQAVNVHSAAQQRQHGQPEPRQKDLVLTSAPCATEGSCSNFASPSCETDIPCTGQQSERASVWNAVHCPGDGGNAGQNFFIPEHMCADSGSPVKGVKEAGVSGRECLVFLDTSSSSSSGSGSAVLVDKKVGEWAEHVAEKGKKVSWRASDDLMNQNGLLGAGCPRDEELTALLHVLGWG